MRQFFPAQLRQFTDEVGADLYRPNHRFLHDALRGMLGAGSVVLARIGRSLAEPRRLIHTEKRLSRGLKSPRFHDGVVHRAYLELVAPTLGRRPVVAVDFSDVIKPKGRKMPYLARIRDASRSSRATTRFGSGWRVLAADVAIGRHRIPLDLQIFSGMEPDFAGAPNQVAQLVRRISPYLDRPIFVADREFHGVNYRHALAQGGDFVVRLVHRGDRTRRVWTRGRHRTELLAELVQHTVLSHVRSVRGHRWRIGYWTEAQIEGSVGSLVMARRGRSLIVLFTSLPIRSIGNAEEALQMYLSRWGLEESFRFVKQAFELEDLRALTWTGIRRIGLLALLAYGFLAQVAGLTRTRPNLFDWQRFGFGEPPFPFYRLAEVAASVFIRSGEPP